MTTEQFEETLRQLIRHRPFSPFTVELRDDNQLIVDDPNALAFDGGLAAFTDGDGMVHFFNNDQVRRLTAGGNGQS